MAESCLEGGSFGVRVLFRGWFIWWQSCLEGGLFGGSLIKRVVHVVAESYLEGGSFGGRVLFRGWFKRRIMKSNYLSLSLVHANELESGFPKSYVHPNRYIKF